MSIRDMLGAWLWWWDFDYLWHFLGGFAFAGAVAIVLALAGGYAWVAFLTVPFVALFGYVREKLQHEMMPLTPHQHVEAWLWPAGSLAAATINLFL